MISRHSRQIKSNTVEGTPDIDENMNQRLSFILKKAKNRQSKTPTSSSRVQIGLHPDPNFTKIMPKDISFDRERLLEENSSIKVKAADVTQENLRLKTRMVELLELRDRESNKKIPRLKMKVREIQNLLIEKDEEMEEMMENIKSSKVYEKENEIESNVKEACRLKFLIEKILCEQINVDYLKFQENARNLAYEIQNLKKENVHLNIAREQTQNEYVTLTEKLDKLMNKKETEILQKKIRKYEKIRNNFKKCFQEQSEGFEKERSELRLMVENLKSKESEKKQELERNELRVIQQDILIKEMKEKLDKEKILKNRRNQTFMPSTLREQIQIKQVNPPRLLIKLNQILKNKKMLISVLLSLIDKNNNGQVHSSVFLSGIKAYGKKIKQKHLDDLMRLIGIGSNYIELSKVEELYEKYRYEDKYQSSTDEEASPKRPSPAISASPASPNSPTSPNQPRKEERKPSTKANVINLEPVPITNEKVVDLTKAYQIKEFLDELRDKMISLKLHKGKIPVFLFGHNFDPDEEMFSQDVENLIRIQVQNFKFVELVPLVARFLIEPESGTFRESAYKKIKGNLRNGCSKLAKHVRDWEVFNDEEEKEFEDNLKAVLTLKYGKIVKMISKNLDEKGIMKFSVFLDVLDKVDASFSERMISWIMLTQGIKNKEADFNVKAFVDNFKTAEPIFVVKPQEYEQKIKSTEDTKLNLNDFISKVSAILKETPSLFPRTFLSFSPDDFLHFLHDIGINLTHDEILFVINGFSIINQDKLAKDFDAKKFIESLRNQGFIPSIEPALKSSRSDSKPELIYIKENDIKEKVIKTEDKLGSKQASNRDLISKNTIEDELSSKISSSGDEESKDIEKNYTKNKSLISSEEIEDFKEEFSDNESEKNSYSDRSEINKKSGSSKSGSVNVNELNDDLEKFSDRSNNENPKLIEENKTKLLKQKERYNYSEEINQEANKSDSQSDDFEEESADYVEDYEDIQEDIEEGKNHGNEGETSLEFEEYGIKFNNIMN